jgi:hypothetical protein
VPCGCRGKIKGRKEKKKRRKKERERKRKEKKTGKKENKLFFHKLCFQNYIQEIIIG